MSGYRNATICFNGHVMSIYYANSQPYCSKCGKETYSYCEKCKAPIRGHYEVSGIVDLTGRYDKPYYCYNCGAPYPWTQRILDNAVELLSLEDELDEQTKQIIKEAIPTLMIESPDTPIAAAKFKNGMDKASQFAKNLFYQLLVDVISETAKKIIFP